MYMSMVVLVLALYHQALSTQPRYISQQRCDVARYQPRTVLNPHPHAPVYSIQAMRDDQWRNISRKPGCPIRACNCESDTKVINTGLQQKHVPASVPQLHLASFFLPVGYPSIPPAHLFHPTAGNGRNASLQNFFRTQLLNPRVMLCRLEQSETWALF